MVISDCKYCGKQPGQQVHDPFKEEHSHLTTPAYWTSCWHDEDEQNIFLGDNASESLLKLE